MVCASRHESSSSNSGFLPQGLLGAGVLRPPGPCPRVPRGGGRVRCYVPPGARAATAASWGLESCTPPARVRTSPSKP
ncbi:hypothetical protein NDU88_003996 [Pleurodeles waltl]|uniref:Uncharacterized protein n=1 Tax=Pleurodeles waltl TaxID=8319 RepID=A0AAV7N1R9_PLEWA|nr:hypothetical protein NDU88_003996 [Pleurodeles waltl]